MVWEIAKMQNLSKFFNGVLPQYLGLPFWT
jgi:hypothetical protein